MGHLEINGFKATRGHMMEDGMPKEVFGRPKDTVIECVVDST